MNTEEMDIAKRELEEQNEMYKEREREVTAEICG